MSLKAFTAIVLLIAGSAEAQKATTMKKKILFVVTSHGQKGNSGEKTGFYLSEVSHPWEVLSNAGYEIDFVSPKGGKAPVDGFNLADPVNKKFWDDAKYRRKIENTMKPSEVNPDDYAAIHYAGGHGTMWDFPDDKRLAEIAARIYETGGIVSAVCHGPAGLVNIKLSDGSYLVAGKRVNAFTNEEETAVRLEKVVPFLLEDKLIERGAKFEKSGLWQSHVVADQRLVTGQNPQSAKAVGEAVLEQLSILGNISKMTKYEIKKGQEASARKVISDYVTEAIADNRNIMAEAYFEKENQSVLWLFERWENKTAFENFGKSKAAKALQSLGKPAETYFVKDLMPLTRQQWRTPARKADDPLVIMLFVDGKAGTQGDFKRTYHEAMPQFRSEPGVITYQLSELENDGTRFVTFEKFRSQAAFDYHLNFPPIRPVIDYLNTRIENPPFQNGLHTMIEFAPMTRE